MKKESSTLITNIKVYLEIYSFDTYISHYKSVHAMTMRCSIEKQLV